MSNAPTKVFIKIESSAEQQENIKNQRKTLKVLQNAAIDKENLAGRPILDKLHRGKVDADLNFSSVELSKRKKLDSRSTQTDQKSPKKKTITVEDLTNPNPGECYWEILAENRRLALDKTLVENKFLHERIEGLEEELSTSRQMLEEARNLVDVLTEMLNENEAENDINQGASTSGASLKPEPESPQSSEEVKVTFSEGEDDE